MVSKLLQNWKQILLFLTSFFLLFFSFQFNTFSSADQNWFEKHQFDSEALVIGRLVKSREDGIFSKEGRLGRYYGLEGKINEIQTKLYLKEITGGNFGAYGSQLGLQGIFFSLVDKLLERYDLIKLENRIDFFHAISSALQALILSIIIFIIYFEIGFVPAVVVLVSMMFSQWLVVFGKNLYWVMGLMFIPMVVVWVFHKLEERTNRFNMKMLLFLVVLSIFLKSATGYEYISAILISMVTPIIYFSIKNNWQLKTFFKRLFLLGIAGVLGLIIAFSTHTYQSSIASKSTFKQALVSQMNHATSRMHTKEDTFGKKSWARAARASSFEVLDKYWDSKLINFNSLAEWKYFKTVNIYDLIYIFLIFSAIGLISSQYSKNIERNRKKIVALTIVTWFSFLAPISWFILAKVHSYVHGHMNHVLWHIPFTIFGFSLVGYVIYLISKDLYERNKYIPSIIVLTIITLLGGNILLDIKESNEEITRLLNTKKLFDISPEKNIHIILTEDNKLIYYIPDCQSRDIGNRFFLHLFPENNKDLKNKKSTFNNYDFNWNQFNIETSKFSSYSDTCIAVRQLPTYPIKSINTGRYSESKRFWQKKIEIQKLVKTTDVVEAYHLSDKNWENGISKTKTGLFIDNSLENRTSLKENDILKFSFSGERKIIKITTSNHYINIDVNGTLLDPVRDGYPNKINIINDRTNNGNN